VIQWALVLTWTDSVMAKETQNEHSREESEESRIEECPRTVKERSDRSETV
jgi:hypothetical protein